MKTAFVAVAVAGLAAGQNLDGIAPCVASCIQQSLPTIGCTGSATDVAICACKSQSQLASPVLGCVTKNSCNFSDLLAAQGIAAKQCAALATGAPIATTGPASSAIASASGSSSSSSSSSAPSVPAVSSATPTASTTAAVVGPTAPSYSGNGTTTAAPTSTVITGGAAAAVGPVAGAVAALFAAAMAL